MAKLKKVNPQVVAKMGFKKKGGLVKRSQGSSTEGEISPRMKRRIDKKIEEEKAKVPKTRKPAKPMTPPKPAKPMTPPIARPTKPRGKTGKPKFKGRVYNI